MPLYWFSTFTRRICKVSVAAVPEVPADVIVQYKRKSRKKKISMQRRRNGDRRTRVLSAEIEEQEFNIVESLCSSCIIVRRVWQSCSAFILLSTLIQTQIFLGIQHLVGWIVKASNVLPLSLSLNFGKHFHRLSFIQTIITFSVEHFELGDCVLWISNR